MPFDLVIRNGEVVDGSGRPPYRADVGIIGTMIARVGAIHRRGAQEIDASGCVVSPGFIDGHTHMDAQIFWDPLGSPSCWHGVTTAVMGNCGFTLAPASETQRPLVVRNLERAEDISREAMAAGIEWGWDTFRSWLDVLESLPKGINYASNVGHSALRTWAMGERAFEQEATEDDLALMEVELRDALRAGAIGFTTSRGTQHQTSDGRPVASLVAGAQEIERLVRVLGDVGTGIFELALNSDWFVRGSDLQTEWFDRLKSIAVGAHVPVTFGLIHRGDGSSEDLMELIDSTCAAGGRMFGQSHCKDLSVVLSFKTRLPFDRLEEWKKVRGLPLTEQRQAFMDRSVRERLVRAAHNGDYGRSVGVDPLAPDYELLRVMKSAMGPNPSVSEVAASLGMDPVDAMIELALETNFDQFFIEPRLNRDLDEVLRILRYPGAVMTFSDSGAHVTQIADSSIHSHLLAYWVRERQAFRLEEAVRMITYVPAKAWGFHDRGLVMEGKKADLNVFDPEHITPELPQLVADLPMGEKRILQKTSGIRATVVGGEIFLREGEHVGALAGRLLRAGVPS